MDTSHCMTSGPYFHTYYVRGGCQPERGLYGRGGVGGGCLLHGTGQTCGRHEITLCYDGVN